MKMSMKKMKVIPKDQLREQQMLIGKETLGR